MDWITMKNLNFKIKAFVCFLMIFALVCMPVSAGEDSIKKVAEEISEDSDKLFELSEAVLLQTKVIVKDETVDQDIRALAKTIHMVSHELEDIASTMQEKSAELQILITDPVKNKAAIEETIGDIEAECNEFNEKLTVQHENVHDLVFRVPESCEANADATHDAAHEAEKVAEHVLEQTQELTAALSAPPSPENTQSASATTTNAKTHVSPGFGVIATIGVLFAVLFAVRKN